MIDEIRDGGGDGGIAQLAEHLHGMQRVGDSSSPASTTTPQPGCTPVCHGTTELGERGMESLGWSVRTRGVRWDGEVCPTLAEAVRQLLAAKSRAGRRAVYVTSLRQYFQIFIRCREHHLLSSISVRDLEEWFADRKEAPTSQAANMGRLSALFSYGVRRGWIEKNPCHRLERVSVEARAPKILTPAQARELIEWVAECRPMCLAWFTLALYAGIRPDECSKLTWETVDLVAGTVRVDACVSKVRHRRIVHLMPLAASWLRRAKEAGAQLPISRSTITRARAEAIIHLKWENWDQDILRHTAASYLLAHHQDAGKVARELGNSAGILLRNYTELVTRDESKEFWEDNGTTHSLLTISTQYPQYPVSVAG